MAKKKPSRSRSKTLLERPLFWVTAIGTAIAGGLAFLSEYGFVWCLVVLAISTAAWWFADVFKQRRKNSRAWTYLTLFIPMLSAIAAASAAFIDLSQLDVWRKDYESTTVRVVRVGPVLKVFGESSPRTTPDERDRFDRNEWLRLMGLGAKSKGPNVSLLYIETEPFERSFRTFTLDVHDLDKGLRPFPGGTAFLICDDAGDPWIRPKFRQLPCDFASDAESRLFRIEVQNANAGESLCLLLCVESINNDLQSRVPNLQLKVR